MKKYSSKVAVLLVVLICAIGLSYSKFGHMQKPATQEQKLLVKDNPTQDSPVKNAQASSEGATDTLIVNVVPKGNIDVCEDLKYKELVDACIEVCKPGGTFSQEALAKKVDPEVITASLKACPNDLKARLIDTCLNKKGSDLEHYSCLKINFAKNGIDLGNAKLGVPDVEVPNIFDALRENKLDHKYIKEKVDKIDKTTQSIDKTTQATHAIVKATKPLIENTNKKVNKIYEKVSGNQIDATAKVGPVPPNGKKKKRGQGGNSDNSLDASARAMYNSGDWNGLCKIIGRLLELDPNNTWYQSIAGYCNARETKQGKKSKRDTVIGATLGTLGDMYVDKPLCDLGIKKSMHGRKCVLNPAGLFFDYLLWDATVNMLPSKMQDNVFGKNRPVPPPPPTPTNGGQTPDSGLSGSGQYCEKCGNVSETTVGADPNALNDSLWGTGWQAPAGTVGGAGTTTSVQGANPWAAPSPRSNPSSTKTSSVETSAVTISATHAVPPPPPPPPPAQPVSGLDESSLF